VRLSHGSRGQRAVPRTRPAVGFSVSVLRDLRHAIRLLRHSAGFSTVAIATIALAIGANTAMFSFVNAVLLSPLPYPDPDRIVRVLERQPGGGLNGVSTLNYLDWTTGNDVFEYIAAEAGWRATLAGDPPVSIRGAQVSAHYFDIFGVKPAMGRTFLPGDDQPGNDHVVLLSYRLWASRFGADPAILGRDVALNGEAYEVIGILPKDGPFDRAAAQIWVPLAFQPSNMTRDYRWLGATAKLKPGVELAIARGVMDAIAIRLAAAYPDSNKGWSVGVDRLSDVLISPEMRTAILILFAATAFVVLIGCANLANLALARAMAREGEMAVRAALGGGRWPLVRQVLTETVVLSVCGGVAGAGIGYVLLKWIAWLIPPYSLPPAVALGMNGRALLFTLAVAVSSGLLFGGAPAVQATNVSPASALRGDRLGTATRSRGPRARAALFVAEVALAFVLLVAAGLLMRSSLNLLEVDPGFDATNVLTASLPIRRDQHANLIELNAYLASIAEAVKAVPGVRETAMTSALPLQGWGYGVPYAIAGRQVTGRTSRRAAFFKIVTPAYFDALRVKLLKGRLLTAADSSGAPPVAVINDTLAKREFRDEEPIGHRLLAPRLVPGSTGFGPDIAWEIVGVVANERINGLGDTISAGMYVSNLQSPTYTVNLIARADVPPESLQAAVQAAVARVSRDQAIGDVRTLADLVDQSMLGNRIAGTILTALAGMALLLAALGVYGVMSYTAVQRTHEMGIRRALGASAGQVRLLFLAAGMRLTLIGLAIGLAGALLTTRSMAAMLYGVEADDPLTIAVVAGLLAAVAGLACLLPASRMTKVDPMDVLRRQ
jgi:putative ABC transport system permease protein